MISEPLSRPAVLDIVALKSGDEQRIEEGARLLEATYAALSVATDSRKL